MKGKETESSAIPRLIHFVWAGGRGLLPQDNMNIIAKWALKNPDFKIYLWVDEKTSGSSFNDLIIRYQESFEQAYKFVCQQEGQPASEIPNIFQVHDIRAEGICAKEDNIVDYELDRVDPNYGASSDILRRRILTKKGGVYADSDVGPGINPLGDLPEFSKCDAQVLYVDHLMQYNTEKLTEELLSSFPAKRDRIGNDSFICTPENPLMTKIGYNIEEENYQLAVRWRRNQDPSIKLSIIDTAYNSFNFKDVTIHRTGPSAVCHVIEDDSYGLLEIDNAKSPSECSKTVGKVKVLIKPLKSLRCQLVEPVVIVRPHTEFKSLNRSAWLDVGLDTTRFYSLNAVFENINKTILFEQKHFGILRLADHLRLLHKVSLEFDVDPKKACQDFIEQLDKSQLIDKEELICVQLCNTDPLIHKFYDKNKLMGKTHLFNREYCEKIYAITTSEQYFNSTMFTDPSLKKITPALWCKFVLDSVVLGEIKNIFEKVAIGSQFIEMLLIHQGMYHEKYPLEKLNNTLLRYQVILERASPLHRIANVNILELMERNKSLQIHIANIIDCKKQVETSLDHGRELFKQKNFEKSLEVYQGCLKRVENVLGKIDEKVATLNYNIASCLINLKQPSEAIPYLRECVNIRTKLFGSKATNTKAASEKLSKLELEVGEQLKK